MTRWSYKPKDINAYTLITKGVRQENSQAKDCTFKGTSSLTVVMSEELDGAHFLCATSGEIGHDGNPRNFDEVELQLHRKFNMSSGIVDIAYNKVAVLL